MGRTDAELEAATVGVRGLLAFYGSTPAYVPVLDVEGWADVQPELNGCRRPATSRRCSTWSPTRC